MRSRETRDDDVPPSSALSRPARWGVAALCAVLGVLALPALGGSLWGTVRTWLDRCELRVTLPTRYEIPVSGQADGTVFINSGGFATGSFSLCGADAAAHAQLVFAEALRTSALVLVVVLVVLLGLRAATNRPVYRLLVRGSVVGGGALIAGSLLSSALTVPALRTIAAQLREAGVESVFPGDVVFTVDLLAVGGGVALLILALVLRAADRAAAELETVV